MVAQRKYPEELRERAVKMVLEAMPLSLFLVMLRG